MSSVGKVSIIVPVYNVEKYLDKCVLSLVDQTYRDLEILLIDDGSKDNSSRICDKWKERDSRIKVFHKQNGGLSDARNFGLKKVTGEFLTFVDSDDWLDPCTIEQTLKVAIRDKSEIVFWPYIRETQSRQQPVHFYPESCRFERQEIQSVLVRRLFGPYGKEVNKPLQMDGFSTACAKLYKTSIILGYSFSFVDLKKIGTFEDGLFNIEVFSKANTVSYLDCNYYHYRRTNAGQLTSTYKPEFFSQTNELYSLMLQLCNELGASENYVALRNRIAIGMSSQALSIVSTSIPPIEKKKRIKDILASDRYREAFEKLDISGMPIHWEVFYFLCKKQLGFGVYFLACIMKRLRVIRNG